MAKSLVATLAAALASAVAARDKLPDAFVVTLRAEDRPGLRQCGEYLPGREYTVSAAEAVRLTTLKGFRLVKPGDADVLKARADAAVNVAKLEAELAQAKAAEAATNHADASPAAAQSEG
jgi:hypothetical protein